MPQESRSRSRRRSVGYRTFITCEDPRGVIEHGTIRKPNITPTQKDEHGKKKPKSDLKRRKSLSLCSKEMEIGGVEEECQSPTSLHLLEVSRGAQKLNNVISSWPDAGHSSKNSKYLAQNLLKGALDLGDSLALLSRFQHSPTKKPHMHMDFVEEMKNVLRNGVGGSRQVETEACFDAPSTSYSRPSIAHSAPNKKKRKTKWPNLIARLMGLEDASLRALPYSNHPSKHMSKDEKILKQQKPAFDDVDKGGGDVPPIVILRPSRFSCHELEQPIMPKSRGEVFQEMFLGMTIRTNPLAQTDDPKPKGKTCSLGKSKHYKKQFVERNGEEGQKLVKTTAESGSHFQSNGGRKGINKSENLVNKTASVVSDDQRSRGEVTEEASQIEITVADYVVDDQSSPSETPLQDHWRIDHVKQSHSDHLTVCPYTEKLRALLLSSPDYGLDHDEMSRLHLLDTANELISLHGCKCSTPILHLPPWTTQYSGCRVHSSLEELLDEACNEIKALNCYATAEGNNQYQSADYRLVMLVKRDLRTTGMVGGMWDVGWTGSADERQELSKDVEELVLDELIQEMIF